MSNKIIVFIDQDQMKAQKNNNYSLFLAKKVNKSFTVIWQSKGAKASVGVPSYEYKNQFDIDTPSYIINYTNDPIKKGDVTFMSGGKDLPIDTGKQTTLDENGIFSAVTNIPDDDDDDIILVNNELQANPKEILKDSNGKNIWVNSESGMDIGTASIKPKHEYQIWFGNIQETGSLIAKNRSKVIVVKMKNGEDKTITYNKKGEWKTGKPS